MCSNGLANPDGEAISTRPNEKVSLMPTPTMQAIRHIDTRAPNETSMIAGKAHTPAL